jgi:hypothetical protein
VLYQIFDIFLSMLRKSIRGGGGREGERERDPCHTDFEE